jgi:hypothetical protein
MEIKQYQIILVNLDPTIGSEILKIKKFLIEINHYNDDWISNAPEHFLIYGKNEMIYRIKNNFH